MGTRTAKKTGRTKTILKAVIIATLLVLYTGSSLLIALMPVRRRSRRALAAANTSFFSRQGLRALGVRITARGPGRLRARRGSHLIVANHLSYVDILILASLVPSVFITSVELRHTAVLGLLARLGGSVFVERRSPAGLKKEIGEIAGVLREGLPVVLFPEGTTSNGESVRTFKNSLFTAAIASGTAILPVCLRYRRIDGEPVSARNRDCVFYHSGTTFFDHAPRLLATGSVKAECIFLSPLAVQKDDSRKHLAQWTHDVISTAYAGKS